MGWATLENGELIRAAEGAGYDVFVTGDQGMFYQQDNSLHRIPIVLLSHTYWPDVEACAALVEEAIEAVKPGGFVRVRVERRKNQAAAVPSKMKSK